MKKLLYIILILIIIAAVGFAAYWFFDKQENGGEGGFNIINYFPFGRSPEGDIGLAPIVGTTENLVGGGEGQLSEVAPPRFWQISSAPQAGAVIFEKDGETFVRYLDKATGNVYESTVSTLGQRRISNTTIPKVYEALWMRDGRSVILRHLPDNGGGIKSLYAEIVVPTVSTSSPEGLKEEVFGELRGTFLPGGIGEISIAPKGDSIFYLTKGLITGSSGYISDPNGGGRKVVFDHEFSGWLSEWPEMSTITLTTKSSFDTFGYMYFLDLRSKSLEKILGGVRGLTTLTSPDARHVLYSENVSGNPSLHVLSVDSGRNIPLPHATLSEKCVWSTLHTSLMYCAVPKILPRANYPDGWYQGVVSFNDLIWQINASTSEAEIVVDPEVAGGSNVDAIDLELSSDERYLIFTNKKDYQLWGLRLLEN